VRCIFVLDILNGAVVHAVRGERSRYEPIAAFSKVVDTSEPLALLNTIRPKEVYVADLNLLTGLGNNLAIINEISQSFRTMADTGIFHAGDLDLLPSSVSPILGTETTSLSLIEDVSQGCVVSIDMKMRQVMASDPELAKMTPMDLLQWLNHLDLEGVILLELDRVGTSAGLDLTFLEKATATSKHPLILGGGAKGEEDLDVLQDLGFSGALIATAVHNCRISLARIR
jgi:phosphoribosylformimino-5-aminoimidazole carboxamide ribotide isomerase